jgi:Mlc titration factor MtfA (ptsG expression regulator)
MDSIATMKLYYSMIDAIFIIAVVVFFGFLMFILLSRKKKPHFVLSESHKNLLLQYVSFYQLLDDGRRKSFENRMQHFLSTVRITGVKTIVEDIDKVLIAASAIVPIFAFDNWQYPNINEVLLYPENFNEEFEMEGAERNVMGMVGTGHMQNVMIISQQQLRDGFLNTTGKVNTAIHEFVHLVDKTDGATDGIPENIMQQQFIVPWLQLMQKTMQEIVNGKSDINPYGATNEAEFFAVVSEYFFERPDLFKEKHPELFQLLENIFKKK